MDMKEHSLRSLIEKWLAPALGSPVRLTRFRPRRAGRGYYVCVEASRSGGSCAIFFFRHEDGTWRVFPPEYKRPAISASVECTAVGESVELVSAEPACGG